MSLRGLIGRPGVGRSTRHEMVIFVNQRPVDSRTLNYALIESYHESLPKGRYPVAFLFFNLPPAAVDVNVHPAKREVRFRSEPAVRGFVIRAVLQRLRECHEVAPVSVLPVAPAPAGAPLAGGSSLSPEGPSPRGPLAPRVPPPPAPPSLRPAFALSAEGAVERAPVAEALGATPSAGPTAATTPAQARQWRFVGLAHGNFGIFETAAGIVLLDRRAAHERIWFERLQAEFTARATASQRLLLPQPVELDPVGSAILIDRREFLAGHGLEVAEFGRHFFRIEAIPAWMEPGDAEGFLRDLLGAIRDGRLPEGNLDLARTELARLAATKAVRLPGRMSEADWAALVVELFACRVPLTSPTGRPTQIELGLGELNRRFQRS
jgi:DNA mismatch repair protein MutL